MASIMKDVEQEGGRSPRKQEMRTLLLAQNRPSVHLKTRSSPDMSTRTRRAEEHDHTDNGRRDALTQPIEMSCWTLHRHVIERAPWNVPLVTAIKSPTPVADKNLVASRRSTRRQEAPGKDDAHTLRKRRCRSQTRWSLPSSTPDGRGRGHIRQITYEHQKPGEIK